MLVTILLGGGRNAEGEKGRERDGERERKIRLVGEEGSLER